MELRELEYFLAITRYGSFSEAARNLHLSQPALTRSMRQLENELGKQLLIRGSRKIKLTPDGQLLMRRAVELLRLADTTISEIRTSDDIIEGDIYVSSGETKGLHFLTQAFRILQADHPDVRLHISSGDAHDVNMNLENGLADFGLLFQPFDTNRYDSIRVPFADRWGILLRRDDPLAENDFIRGQDLINKPLIVSRDFMNSNRVSHLLNIPEDQIHIAASYSLIFNGALMVTDGIGYLLGLDNILNLTETTVNCFRPLYPEITESMFICWKRHAPLSRQAAALLAEMRQQNTADVRFYEKGRGVAGL